MKRFKKYLSGLLIVLLFCSVSPAAFAAETGETAANQFNLLNWTKDRTGEKKVSQTFGPRNTIEFSKLYENYLDNNDTFTPEKTSGFTVSADANDVIEIVVRNNNGTIGIDEPSEPMTLKRATRLILGFNNSEVSYTLTSPITVEKSLMIRSNNASGKKATFTLQEPITVASGATLLIDGSDNTNAYVSDKFVQDVYINDTDGSAIKVQDGAKLRVGAVSLQNSDSTASFIDAEGGTIIIQPTATPTSGGATCDENGLPASVDSDVPMFEPIEDAAAIESNTTVIKASGDTVVEVLGGDIKMTGESTNEPAIVFEENSTGSLKLEGGTISSAYGPAVTIPSGVTVEIPETSTAQITTDEEGARAITLAQGAKVKMADTTVTVGYGENYINNDGIAILSAGATAEGGTAMKQAIVDKAGNIYQGTETEKPTYTKAEDGTIKVDVPAGGSVTVDGVTTEMPVGGSVDGSTGEVVVKANSISLDRESVSLYHNTDNNTVKLTATVDPDTIPVTWSSSDPSVAGVSGDGLVTAHKDGTAVITATAGDKEAKCTINVSTYVYTGKYSYEVFTSVGDNGTLSVDRYATEGDKVTIEVAPDEAYLLDELVVTANGKEVELTDNGDGTYTFTMPSADVRISATFAEDPDWTEPEEPATDVSDIFIDVAPNAWYKDAVQYAYAGGLMTGVSANEFAPDATTTRGMIVSMLARLEGVESANDAGFADVNDEWYATAVNWAASVGVVSGYEDNTFRPNDAITREQLAAILMNYSAYKGEDVSARADLSAYTDQPSAWAEETMSWAVAEGLISGVTADTLQPQGAATRAQVAAILQRFLSE